MSTSEAMSKTHDVPANEFPPLTLHDALALGQYESLPPTTADTDLSEVHRLPLLLRLLSASRPLASLPDLKKVISQENEAEISEDPPTDEWLDDVVQRLEDRAALYSAAEGTEVLAGHLAPHVCRKWSKLAPMPQTRNAKGDKIYDTSALWQAAHNLSRRRKLSETSLGASSEEGNVLSDYNRVGVYDDDEEENDNNVGTTATLSEGQRKKRRKESSSQLLGHPSVLVASPVAVRRQSTGTLTDLELAAEDSQEALATKSWTEVALLVTQSLQQPLSTSSSSGSLVALAVDEASILAQAQSSSTKTSGIMSADLSATLCSLLYHTPVLRYDHVATALCRVGLPQTGQICSRLGGNTPANVPLLVRGCLDVARAVAKAERSDAGLEDHNEDQTSSSRDSGLTAARSVAERSIVALASLSRFEGARAATMLRFSSFQNSPSSRRLSLSLAVGRGDALCIALSVDDTISCLDPANTESLDVALLGSSDGKKELVTAALKCLAGDLSECSQRKTLPSSRVRWLAIAFLRLLTFGGFMPSLDLNWIQILVDRVVEDKLLGDIYRVLFAIASLGFVRCGTSTLQEQNAGTIKIYKGILCRLLNQHLDMTRAAFAAYALVTWKSADSKLLGSFMLKLLRMKHEYLTLLDKFVSENHLLASRFRFLDLFPVDDILKNGMTEEAIANDFSSAAMCLDTPHASASFEIESVRDVLSSILGPSCENAVDYLSKKGVLDFLVNAGKFVCLNSSGQRELPVVLPLQVEKIALLTQSKIANTSHVSVEVARLLLNLAYAIFFAMEQPSSPFLVVMRNLPVDQLYIFLQKIPETRIDPDLRGYVVTGLTKWCSELVLQIRISASLQKFVARNAAEASQNTQVKSLVAVILSSVKDTDSDPNGEKVERLFYRAIGIASWKSLCCSSASATLSVGFPPLLVDYTKICSDPLTLLKVPTICWKRNGFRRVVLTMLSFLCSSNDAMVKSLSEEKAETEDEFVFSRNALLVRCLLSLMDKVAVVRSCVFTIGFLRAAFAQSPGMGAALFRQGVSDSELDWLVVHVPEIMDDGTAYQSLLGLQTISTACERLVAAGAVLRVAVIHGHKNEALTQTLVHGATAQLIANFFIVLGPIGVPVQAFMNEKEGDTTKVCRKAAMRMLQSMSYIQGDQRRLRDECVIALQKLARLCKGEEIVGGLPASVASRQKGFLREMLDGINKNLVAMGSSI